MNIDDFASTSPEFLPEKFLDGKLEGWGILEGLTGGLQKRYTVKAQGIWDPAAEIIAFTETWSFDDGRADTLCWRIRKLADRRYSGEEIRLNGEAEGVRAGCAFNWRYTRDTPQGGGTSTTLDFNDWFYLIDDRIAIVRGSAGRLGIPFAIAHVTYRKL